ncbi:MAG TPA: FAD-binding oxidoreductase [Oceanithermus profundus]|uniref:FAD-binding oxidoreductase n=1 Tax=Oceanithermus profundus TaxID=187137 RepID=A0A7C4Z3Z5_9DEIN|nr:FAD-binding oxidoreductase [Oceanithermus profundus]
MPVLELNADDQYLVARGDTPLLEVYRALPAGLFPPFPPLELPAGVGGLVERGGFAQTFFFPAEVLGLTFETPAGHRVVAGGRVVKNVQGYDLVRPFVGSFGLLGKAVEVVLRLRPGRAAALWRYVEEGPLRPRFVWEAEGERLAFHFGHPRELERAGYREALRIEDELDYTPLFPNGMGVGREGPVKDDRFVWADGGVAPEPSPAFVRLARALDGGRA